jgi:hypothetical protein
VVAATASGPVDVSGDEARVQLRFTSPTKPAVIGPSSGSAGEFRYLVVSQRVG